MTHRILQDMGFKGLVVYGRKESKNGPVYQRLKSMTGNLNHGKKEE